MALLPPIPTGIPPGHSYWNDWYEKLRTLVNQIQSGINWNLITGTPTTLSGYGITDPVELTSRKNTANGYAGLTASNRVLRGTDTQDDLIVDSAGRGVVLKSPDGHYWRSSISNAGVVTWTDLGTTKP